MTEHDDARPVVGLVGSFGEDLDAAITSRVFRHELRNRGCDVRVFFPTSEPVLPRALDAGEPVEPLPERFEHVDALVLVCGPEAIEARAPGVEVFSAPDDAEPGALLPRAVPRDVLDRRVAFLRLVGWYPEQSPVLVVEAGGMLKATGPDSAVTLPPEAGLEDRVAAVVAADDFEGGTSSVAALRTAYRDGAPDTARLAALFDDIAEAARRHRVDDPYARVAELQERLERLRTAYEARGRRLADERVAMADRVDELEREIEALQTELSDERRERDAATGEVDRLRNTKTFRATRGLRALYRRLRRGG